MPFLQVAAFLIAVADFALGGLISNGFLVTMTVMEWAKCKRLSSTGQLLLSVGLSNICATVPVATVLIIEKSDFADNLLFQIMFSFGISVIYFRFWLSAWLCVFYCIKIVNSTWSFILWCKQRISWLIPRLLVGSLLVSFLLSPFSDYTMPMHSRWSNVTGTITNGTQGKTEIDDLSSFRLLFLVTGNVCPFVVVLLCTILSVASLCRHLHHMTGGESGFQSFQTKAHIKAIGTLVSLLFLYILLHLAQTLPFAEILKVEIVPFFAKVMSILYSPVQAVILVLANPKLKCAAIQILKRTQI
uniref:Taste receptor type 2 n=1 Tax=Pogona vitticeps TaxID=103695 RepID=A0ABM5FCN0_9SAUR